MTCWGLSATGWLAVMYALARRGPIGQAPWLDALLYLAGFAGLLLMLRHWPRQWSGRAATMVIVMLALAARGFFWPFPVSNDVYRYIWEGCLQLQGLNPYRLPPDSPALADLASGGLHEIWVQINHKDLAAAYPPLTLLIFRTLAALAPSPAVFKGGILVFDLVLMLTLAWMLRMQRLPAPRLLLYAANPLVLVYVAGEAHLDVIQAAFLMLGLAIAEQRRPAAGFILLGMAAMTKYMAVAVLPFVMTRQNRRAWPLALLPLAAFLPFADAGHLIFDSLLTFGGTMHYNDGLPVIMRWLFGSHAVAVSILILIAAWGFIYLTVPHRMRSIFLALGCLLLLLPTLHPWYLLLIVPFLVFFPSRPWLYLCAAMVFTFPVLAVEHQTGVFQEIFIMKPLIYLPFAALLVHAWRRPDEDWSRGDHPAPATVAAVIPTLNEGADVAAAVRSLRSQTGIAEIVVADGGSTDTTVPQAREAGAAVVEAARGRGPQIRAGIATTHADVILVLHADSRLRPGAVERMMIRLNDCPGAPGGAFGMHFDGRARFTRVIAGLNHLRILTTGISFGDQGQFIRRSALEAVGGFPGCMLMEDVELSLRMKQIGRPLYIADGIRVSDRRWRREGRGSNVVLVIGLFVRYLARRRWRGDAGDGRMFYRRYYRRHQA